MLHKIKNSLLYRYYNNKQNKDNQKYISLIKEKLYNLESLDITEINSTQDKLLHKIISDAYYNSSYYHQLFTQYGISPNNFDKFEDLPTFDKNKAAKYKEEILHKRYKYLDYIYMNTGGSTGQPFAFFRSTLTGTIDSIHQKWQFAMMGYDSEKDIRAGFGGGTIPENKVKNDIYWSDKFDGFTDYSYSSIYLTKDNIKHYIKHFLEKKPNILRGYPSFIYSFAQYIIDKDIEIDFNIKGALLTSENTQDYQVDIIKKAFNTDVYFQYGNSEASVFGFTNKNQWEYYCSPCYGKIEVLDEDNEPVKIGEEGEVVTTGYFNYIFPFIRYRTGDRAIYGGKNKQGITILQKLTGRSQDYIIDSKGNKIALTAIVFGQHYKAFEHIVKWQIVQDEKGKAVMNIIKRDSFLETHSEEFKNNFKKVGQIDIDIKFVEHIPLTPRGKFLFMVQNIR